MLDKENRGSGNDYAFLKNLSTEALHLLVRLDFTLKEEESDSDLILHVVEELESRSKMASPEKLAKISEMLHSIDINTLESKEKDEIQ